MFSFLVSRTVLTVVLLALAWQVRSQLSVDNRKSRIDLHVTADYVHVRSYGAYVTGGILGEYHYSDRISAFFPVSFGVNYFEIGLGTIFAPFGLLSLGEDEKSLTDLVGMFFALVTSIESMGYHIQLGENREIIPYYSLCRLRSFDSEGELSASLGVMLRLHLSERWHINWSGEYSKYYTTRNLSGAEGSISMAYVFR
ncbi:MAG: hypothetical protein RIC35_13965 [Marinoscillum sp.]